MIRATITTQNGKRIEHVFNTKSVRTVYHACRKHLGESYKNTIINNEVVWNFEHGRVVIHGYRHFGYRMDTARMVKDARLESKKEAGII